LVLYKEPLILFKLADESAVTHDPGRWFELENELSLLLPLQRRICWFEAFEKKNVPVAFSGSSPR
jgi:urocanate hydratase